MRYYCTYFDRHYLLRGLALYRSLKQHAEPFVLWVLCFDDESASVLTKLSQPDLIPIALADFERGDVALLAAKPTRSKVEYYFTCSPSLPLYLLNRNPEIDLITYLDADLYFYDSPEAIFAEMAEASILIVGHRFPEHLRFVEVNGIYNVGLVSFRNDARGRTCLEWWRDRCLEWCYDRQEDGKYADQRYLDDWPVRFEGVAVLQHSGAGLAPWNWIASDIKVRHSGIWANGQPLIFFHFSNLKILTPWLYDPVSDGRLYGEMPLGLRRALYTPYLQALKQTAQWLRERGAPGEYFVYQDLRTRSYGWRKFISKLRRGKLMVHRGLK